MLSFGKSFRWKEEETISIIDRSKQIVELTKAGYKFNPKTVTEKVGIEVEGFEKSELRPEGKVSTVMNEVKNLYKDFI